MAALLTDSPHSSFLFLLVVGVDGAARPDVDTAEAVEAPGAGKKTIIEQTRIRKNTKAITGNGGKIAKSSAKFIVISDCMVVGAALEIKLELGINLVALLERISALDNTMIELHYNRKKG